MFQMFDRLSNLKYNTCKFMVQERSISMSKFLADSFAFSQDTQAHNVFPQSQYL